ncbi:MAG: hypothetical protein AAF577_05950 [Pseudomonadota bacterium]
MGAGDGVEAEDVGTVVHGRAELLATPPGVIGTADASPLVGEDSANDGPAMVRLAAVGVVA